MKFRLVYFTSLVAALISGCLKSSPSPAVPLPTGSFSGGFMAIHNPASSLYGTIAKADTLKAALQLSLSQSTGFQVSGDTSIHAGSYGDYGVNAYNIEFVDETYSPAQAFTKYHLDGVYNYTYNGSTLNIYINYADTLSLQYVFKKIN